MGKKHCVLLIVVTLLLFSVTVFAGEPDMKEGLWEITLKMEVPGMPMQMPPQTYTHCMTKKDHVPQKQESDQDCKMIKHDIKGDTVTWVLECKTTEGTALSNGRVTFKGDSFQGVVKVEHGGTEFSQHLKGKWIGQCK